MKSGVSLQQMLTEVKRQSESKEDYLIAPNRLRMESYGKEMLSLAPLNVVYKKKSIDKTRRIRYFENIPQTKDWQSSLHRREYGQDSYL